jgi:hypothetical protein
MQGLVVRGHLRHQEVRVAQEQLAAAAAVEVLVALQIQTGLAEHQCSAAAAAERQLLTQVLAQVPVALLFLVVLAELDLTIAMPQLPGLSLAAVAVDRNKATLAQVVTVKLL